MPRLAGPFQQQVLGPDVLAHVAAAFQGVATVVPQQQGQGHKAASPASSASSASSSSCQVVLEVDAALLARLSSSQREGWSRSLASVRLLLAGHPIRQVFLALEAGSLQAGPAVVCCNTPGQVYVIKPEGEAVTLVFPLRFSSRQDCAIGVACLQEFVEARRGAALGRAPSCAYNVREPPGEMAGVDLSGLVPSAPSSLPSAPSSSRPSAGSFPGGFLSFSFSRRHVSGPQMEGVVWSMACLHTFVAYHVKASKAMMHSRMRRRVAAMIELLGVQGTGPGGLVAAAGAVGTAGGPIPPP